MLADITAMGPGSAGTLVGLGASSQGGFAGVKDKTDQLDDLFS